MTPAWSFGPGEIPPAPFPPTGHCYWPTFLSPFSYYHCECGKDFDDHAAYREHLRAAAKLQDLAEGVPL